MVSHRLQSCKTVAHHTSLHRRQLNKLQQLDYIRAVKCLYSLPSKTQLMQGKARTRFEDFMALHISLTDEIHGVGQFLPWHRRMLRVYEETLRTECSYRGAQP
jgi:tyrosinase